LGNNLIFNLLPTGFTSSVFVCLNTQGYANFAFKPNYLFN